MVAIARQVLSVEKKALLPSVNATCTAMISPDGPSPPKAILVARTAKRFPEGASEHVNICAVLQMSATSGDERVRTPFTKSENLSSAVMTTTADFAVFPLGEENLKRNARSPPGALGGEASVVHIQDAALNAEERPTDTTLEFFPIHSLGLQSCCASIPVVKVEDAEDDPAVVVTATVQRYFVSDFSPGPAYWMRYGMDEATTPLSQTSLAPAALAETLSWYEI
jgi:hypothetical protein